jgi:hypothetical protein
MRASIFRVSRTIPLGPGKSERELTVGADVFNVTNRVNYGSYIGTIGSALFLQPTSVRPAPAGRSMPSRSQSPAIR